MFSQNNGGVLQDETFIAGDTKKLEFRFVDKDGVPMDLSLFNVNLKVSYYGEKSFAILEKDGVITDAKNGEFSVQLNSDDTQYWEEGYYVFQAIAKQGDYNTAKAEGKWFVKGAIL